MTGKYQPMKGMSQGRLCPLARPVPTVQRKYHERNEETTKEKNTLRQTDNIPLVVNRTKKRTEMIRHSIKR